MAIRIKTTQQQAKWATELWQAAELKLASLEQQQQQQPPLSLPAPTNEASPPKPSLSATISSDDDPKHRRVATAEASTMTDLLQTIEEASPAKRQPRPQTSHASTQTVPPPVETTTETSPKADRTPSLQTRHASTQTPQPPVFMERSAQTDTIPLPRTT